MTLRSLYQIAAVTIIAGSVVGALATAAELATAPYSPNVSLYEWNAAVHVIKYVAMLLLIIGLPVVLAVQVPKIGIAALLGLFGIVAGIGLAGTPYNVLEIAIDPSFGVPEARAFLDRANSAPVAYGLMAMIGFLSLIAGSITFGISSWRARVLPGWAPRLALLGLGIAFAEDFFLPTSLAGVVPHGPTWILLGIAAYGAGLWSMVSSPESASIPALPSE
jgi:hypothetical protein